MAEMKNILADLKEQIRFLSELGVEGLEADLKGDEPGPEGGIRHTDFQTYIPETGEIIRSAADSEPRRSGKSHSDDVGGLDQFRLSRARTLDQPKEPVLKSPDRIHDESDNRNEGPSSASGLSLFGSDAATLPESGEELPDIHNDIGNDCERCRLCEGRKQVVNSVGNPDADLMFIGEAPGADEDEQGEPFVGRAGQLLTKIIEAIGLRREDVFIGNINRCRPPENRRPLADEAEVCRPFLLREIAVVKPKVIVVLGNTACQNLLDTKTGITKLRGRFIDYYGIKVMPTFHPAYLLRDPRKKREVWEDMKMVRTELESVR